MRPFEEVIAEHGDVVMRVCRALLGQSDAEDAWSEAFLAALRAYPDLRPDSNVRGWLVTIAHRKAIDQLRSRSRRPIPDDGITDVPARDAQPVEPDEQLREALLTLPSKQRAAVVFHYLADLPYAEVGALIETSAAAARRNAADGIANLRLRYPKGTDR